MKERQSVMYDPAKVVTWLNDNAAYSRQTVRVGLGNWMTTEEIAACHKEGDFEKLLEDRLPDGWPTFFQHAEGWSREKRGSVPWITVDHRIETLDQLHTMQALLSHRGSQSTELAYRELFAYGWIRVEIAGRRWWMEPPEPINGIGFAVPVMAAAAAGCIMTQPKAAGA